MTTMMILINALLLIGFTVMAADTFKNYNPWSAVSMVAALVTFMAINV
jgi:hypothetical protein